MEPQCEKTYFLTCAPNEDSDQPANLDPDHSLHCPHEETSNPWLSKIAPFEDSDQTA